MVGNTAMSAPGLEAAFNGKPLSAGPLFGRTIDVMAVNHVPSFTVLASAAVLYTQCAVCMMGPSIYNDFRENVPRKPQHTFNYCLKSCTYIVLK